MKRFLALMAFGALIAAAVPPAAHAAPIWPQCVRPDGSPCPPPAPGCVQENGMPCSGAPADLNAACAQNPAICAWITHGGFGF
jgi:hypothetical protein